MPALPVAAADAPAAPSTPAGVTLRSDLAYDAHPRQRLDLYLPTGRMRAPRPVILYLHGGNWNSGSKAEGRALALRFVAQGYAAACVDYRLSGDAEFPAQIEDCKSAVRWLRANARANGLDPEHIGVIGVSAGGHLAALLGAMNSSHLYESGASLDQPSKVQGVCVISAPLDLRQLYDASRALGTPLAEDIVQLLGGPPAQVPVPTAASDPIPFVDRDSPPFLILHGDRDPVVPLAQARRLYDAIVEQHFSAHLHVIHGAGNGGTAFFSPGICAMVDEYFTQTLRRGTRPPELDPAVLTESTAATP